MGAPRKNWTQNEETMFLELYCTNRRRGLQKTAARKAAMQTAVEPERHYSDVSMKSAQCLTRYIQDQISIIELNHLTPLSQPWVASMSDPEELVIVPAKSEVIAPTAITIEGLMSQMIGLLRKEIKAELEVEMIKRQDETFQSVLDYFTDPERPNEPLTMEAVKARRKIVIVGLLDQQFHMIQKEFKDMRLVGIPANHVGSKLAAAAVGAAAVMVMVDWVSHDAQHIAQKHCQTVMLVSGTMTRLRERLKKIKEGN